MMITPVTDARSNPNDQIAHAANVLKRSARLQKVFNAVCKGGTKPKTVRQLMTATGYSQVAVSQLAGKLSDQQLIHKTRVAGKIAYQKDRFYATNRSKIMAAALDPKKLNKIHTKYAPKGSAVAITIRLPHLSTKPQITPVTCDDFDQFFKAKKANNHSTRAVSEKRFKDGILKLIGESGKFQDWGGEPNDLYTSKLRHKGQRRPIAFAFKGPGTTGVLTPKKLGKNGNQIQRLFQAPAEIFIVQYHGQIDQDVVDQMKTYATVNSLRDGKRVWYGVIDGDDTNRLLNAYPRAFGLK